MGGGAGGAIRIAAKVAGISAATSSLRGGVSVVPAAEHSVMRNASRPASAIISSAGVTAEAPPQNSWVMVDDWDVALDEAPLVSSAFGSGDRMPRLVFGGPPSLEEAMSATNDLKDALEKVSVSSRNLISHGDSPQAGKMPSVALLSNSNNCLETRDCISFNSKAVPKAAIQAFTFLCESPAAQSVVASIVSDEKVWNAVLDNPALKDFLESSMTHHEAEDKQFNNEPEVEHSDESCESKNTANAFSEFLDKVKMTVTGLVNDVSGFIQDIFGSQSPKDGTKESQESGSSSSTFIDKMSASFFALATLVIMLVVLKRA